MALQIGSISNFTASSSCKPKVLVQQIKYQRRINLDLENIPVNADGCPTGFPLLGGELWATIDLDSEKVNVTSTYSSDNGYYENQITVDLKGYDKAKRDAICNLLNLCDLVFYIAYNDCTEEIVGIEPSLADSTVWVQPFPSRVSDHSNSKGNDNEASNLITFSFKSNCPAMIAAAGIDNLPSL